MKGLGETSPFHRFTNPRRDKSVYFWSWGTYLLFNIKFIRLDKKTLNGSAIPMRFLVAPDIKRHEHGILYTCISAHAFVDISSNGQSQMDTEGVTVFFCVFF